MAITLHLSGGASNANVLASIGGAISTATVPSLLFSPITAAQFTAGRVMYRCLYVKVDVATDAVKPWISAETPSASTTIAIGWGAAINATETAIANETTAPSGVSFASPASEGAATSGGNFTAGQFRALWLRFTITAGATPVASETFQLRINGAVVTVSVGLVPVISGGYRLDDSTYQRLWGPGVNFIDYLSNIRVGRPDGFEYAPSFRFRALHSGHLASIRLFFKGGADYAAGNGGTIRIRVFPDTGSPNYRPDVAASALASASFTLDMTGGVLASSETFAVRSLTSTTPLVAGQIYHVFFDNTAADPVANYVSVNCVAAEVPNGPSNRWLSPWDWGVVYGTRSTPWTGAFGWTEWTNSDGGGSGWYNTPVLQVNYAGGATQGFSNMETGNIDDTPDYGVYKRSSTQPIRERFTPPTSRTIVAFSFHTAKISGSGGLVWAIKNGSTTIATATIPDTGNSYSKTAGDTGLYGWRDVTLSSPVALTGGVTYDLEFTPASSSVWAFAMQRNGGAFGFTYPAAFTQSQAQHWTGSTWIGAYNWDHTTNGTFSNWRVVLHTTDGAEAPAPSPPPPPAPPPPPPPPASIDAVLVGTGHQSTSGASTTTSAGTTAATGSTFVLVFAWGGGGSPTGVTDNKGNTYTQRGALLTSAPSGAKSAVFVCEDGVGGASHTATVGVTSGGTDSTLRLIEITGALASSLDVFPDGVNDTATPYTASTGTLAQANSLVLSVCAVNAASSWANPTSHACTDFTLVSTEVDSVSYWPNAVAKRVVSSTASVSASWTATGSTAAYVHMLAFKQA